MASTTSPGTLPPGGGGGATTIPPGMTFPPEMSMPPGSTIPPGTTLSPQAMGLLQNATAADILGNPNGGGTTSIGDGPPALPTVNFSNIVNATPFFLPTPITTYQKTAATKSFGAIPRFGHTNDFGKIALLAYGDSSSKADGEDYILGLMFVGCFLLIFFLIWTLVLVIFKVALQGFLSGEPFANPHISDPASLKAKEDAEIDGEEYIEDTDWLKRPRRIRITFFICGFLQILFAILLVTQGVSNLQQTTDTVQVSTSGLRVLIDEAIQVSDNLQQVGNTGLILRDQIVFDLNRDNFCPDNPIFAQTEAGKNMIAAADGAVTMLAQLGDFIGTNVATLEQSLDDGVRNLDEVDKQIEDVESNEWLGGLVAFPYLILASLMMIGALAAQLNVMTECFLCNLNWIILPLFTFVTIMAYVALGAFSIAASLNADFCGGEGPKSPDQVILDVMHYSGFKQDDLFFKTVRYYTNQCTELALEDPFLFLRNFDGWIIEGRAAVQELSKSMDGITLDQLSLGCNRDFRPLHRSLSQMVGVLDALLQASNRAINLLRCQRIVPVYTNIVYEATCTHSVKGFAWIFSSLLIVSIMGMTMITLRASYQNTVFEKPPELMDESSSLYVTKQKSSRRRG